MKKKLHKIGTSILLSLSPALLLGMVAGVITKTIKNKQPEEVKSILMPPDAVVTNKESGKVSLAAQVIADNPTNVKLVWSSSDESAISVDKDTGILTYNQVNVSATITCSTVSGSHKASCVVTTKQETDVSLFSFNSYVSGSQRYFYITGLATGAEAPAELVLPTEYMYEGAACPISECYFESSITTVTSIVIPSSYEYIQVYGLTNLTNAYFSDTNQSNFRSIGYYAFANLKSLKKVRFNNSLIYLSLCF